MSAAHPFDLTGKRFLVTGAASGIGAATCVVLSGLGAKLVMLDRNEPGLEATRSKCRPGDVVITIDLSDTSGIKDRVLQSVDLIAPLNGIIHLAGIPYISPLKSISEAKYAEVMKVNTYAGLELAKLYASKKLSGGLPGSIVFVASVYALVGSAGNAGYAMSKAALLGLTKSLAIELAPKALRVNCVAPGFIRTAMMDVNDRYFDEGYEAKLTELHPLGLGAAEDIAHTCAFLLSDAAKWITGSVINVDGGFTAK